MTRSKVQLVRPRTNRTTAAEYATGEARTNGEALVGKSGNPGIVKKIPPIPPSIEGGRIGGFLPDDENEVKRERVLAEILGLVDQLGTKQRKELLARLSLAQQSHTGDNRDLDMWVVALQQALLASSGLGDGGVLGLVPLKRQWSPVSTWGLVAGFMHRARLDSMSVPQRQGFYYMLADLLVAHTKKIAEHVHAPLTAKMVLGQAANLDAVFDQAFPGYLAAGLGPILAARMINKTEH